MTRQTPWFRFDCRAWLDGTRALPPDVRGLYVDVLAIMYDRDGPIRDDDRWIAHQLHVSPRKWRAVRDVLVACGKLAVRDGTLINVRTQSELEQRAKQRRTNAENGANRARTDDENCEKPNVVSDPCQRNGAYARGRENQSQNQNQKKTDSFDSEKTGFGFDDDDDGGAGTLARIVGRAQTDLWRRDERDWLKQAVPRFVRDERGLRTWLANLEMTCGADAVTRAIAAARPYVETGDVQNVQGYITRAAQKLASGQRTVGGLQ